MMRSSGKVWRQLFHYDGKEVPEDMMRKLIQCKNVEVFDLKKDPTPIREYGIRAVPAVRDPATDKVYYGTERVRMADPDDYSDLDDEIPF